MIKRFFKNFRLMFKQIFAFYINIVLFELAKSTITILSVFSIIFDHLKDRDENRDLI